MIEKTYQIQGHLYLSIKWHLNFYDLLRPGHLK